MINLNPLQFASTVEPGSLVITAGAGTGKTFVLAERYYNLLMSNEWGPLEIVAVTFTEKAADELRSRIRETVTRNGIAPRIAAEVEAAQISTIHSLAARICRDFYDIAGIPSDFRLMDTNQSALWTLGTIEEAIGSACEREARELGYLFLRSALSQLVTDPYTAEEAFANSDEQRWRDAVEQACGSTREQFCAYLESAECVRRLRSIEGTAGDLMEIQRRGALAAVDAVLAGNFGNADQIALINLKGGAPRNWPDGYLAEAKAHLTELRKACAEFINGCNLQYGPADEELLAKINIIRRAYEKVHAYLSDAKLSEKFLDYNDLERYALNILQNAAVRAHYRERWKAFLIDEFQDTNPIQAELLRLLTSDANVTVVGDEKQSIYGFRGADVQVFREFSHNIISSGGKHINLEETYRANSSLVDTMNRVFDPLLGALHQPLVSNREYGGDVPAPIVFEFVESDEREKARKQNIEARHLARVIRRMIDDKVPIYDKSTKSYRAADYRDFAVLSRVWEPLEIYGDAFAAENIPAVNAGGGSLIKTREFKDAFALVTFLADQLDDLSLAAILRSPFFCVSDRELYRFALSIKKRASWWQALQAAETLDAPLSAARDCLERLLKERTHLSPESLLQLAAQGTGYTAVIANLPHAGRREADWRGVLQFVRALQQQGWEDLFSVARYMRTAVRSELEIERPTMESGNAVSLMTIHAAKGLEWPVVFIPDLARKFQSNNGSNVRVDRELGVAFSWENDLGEKVEPSIYTVIRQRARESEEAERRRILYVAITRAGDFVHLSSTGSTGASLDLLQPGLEAAGIPASSIPFSSADLLPPAPGVPDDFPEMAADTEPVTIVSESVSATGMSSYAACPQKYKFGFVDGHPGVAEGYGSAAAIGTLAHLALELDIDSFDTLKLHSGGGDDDIVTKALEQARNFRVSEAFAGVRNLEAKRELRFTADVGDIRFYGIADLVGEDFVLDYKTDAEADPDKHELQLWAYARALGKQKAYIAYLRHNVLHEISADRLAQLDAVGRALIGRLRSGDFAATPSETTCGRCSYRAICSFAYRDLSPPAI